MRVDGRDMAGDIVVPSLSDSYFVSEHTPRSLTLSSADSLIACFKGLYCAVHRLDENTRTLSVHVEVANPGDLLHPGQFVTAAIQSKNGTAGITVPVEAVLRSPHGDWQVFGEQAPGRYAGRTVIVVRTVDDKDRFAVY